MTKNQFEKAGIDFIEKNIDDDFEALADVQLLGFASAPVVVHDTMVWSGFQPDKVKHIIAFEKGRI